MSKERMRGRDSTRGLAAAAVTVIGLASFAGGEDRVRQEPVLGLATGFAGLMAFLFTPLVSMRLACARSRAERDLDVAVAYHPSRRKPGLRKAPGFRCAP